MEEITSVRGPGGLKIERDLHFSARASLGVYAEAALRQKLGDDPASPRYILTEPGVGYRFLME